MHTSNDWSSLPSVFDCFHISTGRLKLNYWSEQTPGNEVSFDIKPFYKSILPPTATSGEWGVKTNH